jgi:hypothetical protein
MKKLIFNVYKFGEVYQFVFDNANESLIEIIQEGISSLVLGEVPYFYISQGDHSFLLTKESLKDGIVQFNFVDSDLYDSLNDSIDQPNTFLKPKNNRSN